MALPWLVHPKPDLNELLNLTSPILDSTKYRTRLFGDFYSLSSIVNLLYD